METLKEYIKNNEHRFIDEWFSLIRIHSVS